MNSNSFWRMTGHLPESTKKLIYIVLLLGLILVLAMVKFGVY